MSYSSLILNLVVLLSAFMLFNLPALLKTLRVTFPSGSVVVSDVPPVSTPVVIS
jgi:hypothetical protein